MLLTRYKESFLFCLYKDLVVGMTRNARGKPPIFWNSVQGTVDIPYGYSPRVTRRWSGWSAQGRRKPPDKLQHQTIQRRQASWPPTDGRSTHKLDVYFISSLPVLGCLKSLKRLFFNAMNWHMIYEMDI